MFKYVDGFTVFIATIVISVLIVGGTAIFSDHNIECYYLQTTSIPDAGISVYKIYGKRNWTEDVRTFQSIDFKETFDIFKELDNKCIEKK